ncbi:MAG: SDR family oxidoreductase [Rhodospirillaceae bacterium]|nr:SDR family oxidoreductase [Rhodospirillaceae bacterium]
MTFDAMMRRQFLAGGLMTAAGTLACTRAFAQSKPTVLVAGASGGTGRLIAAALLKEGFAVRGLTREPERAAPAGDPAIQWVKGDVKDAASLPAAIGGAKIVMSAVGAREPQGENRPEKIDWEGVRNLIDAAKAATVDHFVLESSCNVTIPEHNFNKIFNGLLLWKLKSEDHLRASGLGFTIVRPPQLLDEPGGLKGIRFQQGDLGGPGQIARADVAAVMTAALSHRAARNTTFEIFGDDSRPPGAWRESFTALKPGCFDRPSCGLPAQEEPR